MIKVIGFKKLKSGNKKYEITFEKNGRKYIRKFGAAGMSDYTIHKDKSRRERYISRHKKDLRTNDPMKPGYLSMYILWNKPTVKASLADYKRRLNVYNRTGKFPKGITGSKKLSFGTVEIPFEQTSMNILPRDIQNLIKQHNAAMTIQGPAKKMNAKRSLIDALKIRGYTRYQRGGRNTGNKNFLNKLWTNLDPENEFTSKWFTRVAKVLTKKDFDFKTRNFWWKIVENNLTILDEMTEDGTEDPREYLDEPNRTYYLDTLEALVKILNKTGYNTTLSATNSLDWPANALNWWKSKRTNFGTSSIIPRQGTYLERLPDDLFDEMIQRPRSGEFITRNLTKARQRQALRIVEMLRKIGEEKYRRIGKPSAKAFITNLILNYDITQDSGVRITEEMAKLLTKEDFRGKSFWWRLVLDGLQQVEGLIEEAEDFSEEENINFEINREILTEIIVPRYVVPPRGATVTDIIELWENFDNNVSFGKKQKTKGSKIPDNVVNKALYSRIKAKIRKDVNKKKRRWGAYDSGRLVREYKANGGKYRGGKGKTNLGRWYKEKWVDACAWPKRKSCGRKTKEKIAYCRPSKKIDSKTPKLVQDLTKAQIKSRCAKKKRSPMKRVTKFGNVITTPDSVASWDGRIGAAIIGRKGDFVKHCTFQENVGPHITIRYKPPDPRAGGTLERTNRRVRIPAADDIAWHFGMFKNRRGRLLGPTLWFGAGNVDAGLNIVPPAPLMCELVFGYNECVDKFIRDYNFSFLGTTARQATNRLKRGGDFRFHNDGCIRRERNRLSQAARMVQARYRGQRDRDWFEDNRDNLRVTRQAQRAQRAMEKFIAEGRIKEIETGQSLLPGPITLNPDATLFIPRPM